MNNEKEKLTCMHLNEKWIVMSFFENSVSTKSQLFTMSSNSRYGVFAITITPTVHINTTYHIYCVRHCRGQEKKMKISPGRKIEKIGYPSLTIIPL